MRNELRANEMKQVNAGAGAGAGAGTNYSGLDFFKKTMNELFPDAKKEVSSGKGWKNTKYTWLDGKITFEENKVTE